MAKLNAAQRRALPKSDFGASGGRFPMPDANHARAALSGASRALHAGTISKATYDHIIAMADRKLGKTPKGHGH